MLKLALPNRYKIGEEARSKSGLARIPIGCMVFNLFVIGKFLSYSLFYPKPISINRTFGV